MLSCQNTLPVYQCGEALAAASSITSYAISEHKWASNDLPQIQMLAKASQVNPGYISLLSLCVEEHLCFILHQ
jgi:hypothetical protein